MQMNKNRIFRLNREEPGKGDYVLYWMQASQSYYDNHALYRAIERANELQLPLVVLFCIMPESSTDNFRHYDFLIRGLYETRDAIEAAGIKFILKWGAIQESVLELSRNAALVISDASPLPHMVDLRRSIAQELNIQYLQGDSNSIVPFIIASDKEESGIYSISRKIMSQLGDFLDLPNEPPKIDNIWTEDKKIESSFTLEEAHEKLKDYKYENNCIVSDYFTPGYSSGMRRMEEFFSTGKLESYHLDGNDPAREGKSLLSPYLHFGQISTVRVCMAALKYSGGTGCQAFIKELAVRKGLAENFVFFNDNYFNIRSLPHWALTTLNEHISDKREYIYTLEQLESGETHDPYWNAAQKEMTLTGYMHGYMRAYWGKRVIEWSLTPKDAYDRLIYLNDKYQLDGHDANGYAGIAGCFGKHDREWFEKPVLGSVRSMDSSELGWNFDLDKYVKRVNSLKKQSAGK